MTKTGSIGYIFYLIMSNNTINPVGMFDSGLGGVTVWKRVTELLPSESVVYYGDNLNCPYGSRSEEEILELTCKGVEFLLEKGCKSVVVACNTATAAAIDKLRSIYDIEFIGMEPAVKPASVNSVTSAVGVLATRGTLNGRLFNETSRRFASGIELVVQIGEGLVELVETGESNSEEARRLLKKYIEPMMEKSVDHIVLGCTHYPFYTEQIERMTGNRIKVLDPAPAVAKQLKRKLEERELLNSDNTKPFHAFYFTGAIDVAEKLLKQISSSEFKIEKIDKN